jgi:hypothetical protein
MSSPRPSWRPLLAGTLGLFLVILAFLAGQLKSGGDPALGRTPAAVQQTTDGSTGAPPQSGGGTDPSGGGFGTAPDDGFVPGGSAPAPPVPDGSSAQAPTTHQS